MDARRRNIIFMAIVLVIPLEHNLWLGILKVLFELKSILDKHSPLPHYSLSSFDNFAGVCRCCIYLSFPTQFFCLRSFRQIHKYISMNDITSPTPFKVFLATCLYSIMFT